MDVHTYLQDIDIKNILAEYSITKLLDNSIEKLKAKFSTLERNKENEIKIVVDYQKIEEKIGIALIQTYNFTKDISFRDLDKAKYIIEAYVDTHFYSSQRRTQVQNIMPKRLSESDIFNKNTRNLVVLGDLGSGKTTLVKKLCQSIFLKDKKYYIDLKFPILIRLSELNNYKSELPNFIFFDFLISKLGFDVEKESEKNNDRFKINSIKKIVCEFIEDIESLILLDGFDEINNREIQKIVVDDFELICSSVFKSKVILTSRTAEFDYDITNTTTYEIAPLNDVQINQFVKQYINNEKDSVTFKNELFQTPYFDTSRKPLALAHLCAIYERYGSLPPKPKSIYKKIVNLYIEEWDLQRRLNRKKIGEDISMYNNLPNDRKFEFLTKFAYLLTVNFNNTYIFSENDILKCYNILYEEFDLPANQSKLIVKEIESLNGIIIQSSYETFEFSHKSIQEYLCADYISRMGSLPRAQGLLTDLPYELAIATSLSSEPNSFLFRLIIKYIKTNIKHKDFTKPFLSRLLVEKPDFKSDPILGLTFSYIYTIAIFEDLSRLNKHAINEDFEIEQLLNELFISSDVLKKSLGKFLGYYTADYNFVYNSKNDYETKFVRIRKNKNIETIPINDQPELLVVPKILIKNYA